MHFTCDGAWRPGVGFDRRRGVAGKAEGSRAARLASRRRRSRRRLKLTASVTLAVALSIFAVVASGAAVLTGIASPQVSSSAVAADPAPSFVACGPSRDSAMNSPYTTFALAKAAFSNTSAVDLPAGDNSGLLGNSTIDANTTYYFAPGVHHLGNGEFDQIIPKSGDVFVGAPGAILDGQDKNAYAFTQQATNVRIEFLEVRHFVSPLDQGVVNHDAGSGWVMTHNYMHDNGGAAMFLGDSNTAQYNCLDHNAQYGFQIFGDTVTVSFNEISRNDSANVESSNPGCGCSGGMKAWEARNVVLKNNWVHDNINVGLWVDTNNVGFDISNNLITDNTAEAIIYETSYNFHITNNYIARNDFAQGLENEGFPNPAIYISESGGDARVGSTFANSEVANNTLVDNWGGVTLWENANRYCAGAGGDHVCTLVNPSVATMSTCGSTLLATSPYIDDCRWKTKNVSVHDNSMSLTPANVPSCTAANGCGNNALISQAGGCNGPCSPGDPYMGDFVMDNITFNQNNHFSNNTYRGPWLFEAHEQNHHVSFSSWQAAPYNQDAGSTLSPITPGGTTTTTAATTTTSTTKPSTTTTATTTTTTTVPKTTTTTTTTPSTTTSTTTTVPSTTSTTTTAPTTTSTTTTTGTTTTTTGTTTTTTTSTSTTTTPTTSTSTTTTVPRTTTSSTSTTSTTRAPTTTSTSTTSTTSPEGGTTTTTSVPVPIANAVTVAPGGSLTITDEGWAPHSKVDLELHSDPVFLGSAQADGNGAIKTTVVIPTDTEPGAHQIVLTGTDPNGDPQTHTLAVTVESSTVTTEGGIGSDGASGTSSSETSGDLPRTGEPVLPLSILGVSMIGVGVALWSRRRRAA